MEVVVVELVVVEVWTKKRLILNNLLTKEIEDLGAKFKAEIKAMVEELVEKFLSKV